MQRHSKLIVGMALLAFARVEGQGTPSSQPLSVEAALAQPSFQPYAPIALSPDDRWIAYTLKYPNRAERSTVNAWFTPTGVSNIAVGTRVRITEVSTGRTVVVGNDAATSWGPSWSPDGKHLAFYSDAGGLANLWVREMATGRTRRVSSAIVRAHRAFEYPRWTPDSRRIMLPILPLGSSLPEAMPARPETPGVTLTDSATVAVLRAEPALRYGGQGKGATSTDNRDALKADLAVIELTTGVVTTIASGYWPTEYQISADGRFLAFTSERPAVFHGRWLVPYDLLVARLDGGRPGGLDTIVANATIDNFVRGVFWSPRGATLLYSVRDSTGKHAFFAADSNGWTARPIATTGAAVIATDSIASFGRSIWWDRRGNAFYILGTHTVATVSMPDGVVRSLVRVPADLEPLALVERQLLETACTDGAGLLTLAFRNQASKNMGFLRLDPATGRSRVLRDENHHYGGRLDVRIDAARDGRVAYLSEDAQHPTDVWLASPDLAMTRRLTHVAPEMESVRFGSTRLIDFKTTSGAARRGTLLLPSGYQPGKRYPLVVYPYPSDMRSEDVNVFGITGPGTENMQLLATRGFAILAPDVWPFDTKDEMRELASIIMPGIDRVIELGIADSARLGVIGHSWGGYTVMALIAQTPRFGAAVMRGGMADLSAGTAIMSTSGYAYGIMLHETFLGAPLWEQPELYRKNSPIYLLDRVRTPLLIIHGEGETTVPIFLADQVFAGLQRLGREVEFARYTNENHTEAFWASANQRDYLSRVIGWFESHLKGERKTVSPAPALR